MSDRLPESICRNCGLPSSAATHIEGDDISPEPGNFSICVRCRTLSIFANDLTLREPTEDEWTEIASDKDIKKATWIVANLPDKLRRKMMGGHYGC